MTKKILALLLAAVMATMALASCGKEVEEGNTKETETAASTEAGKGTGSTTVNKYVPGSDVNADKVSISTENFSVTNTGAAYFFNSSYQSLLQYIEYYGMSYEDLGLDISKSLKEQDCEFYEGTWFDYVMETDVKTSITEILSICEAAKAAGFELTADQKKTIDDQFTQITSYATQEGKSVEEFIKSYYGADATTDVIYDMMELSLYASAYVEDCVNKADVSDAALEAKYNADPNKIDTVDFVLISLDYNEIIPEDADDAAKEQAKNDCRTYASEIAKATDKDAFVEAVKSRLIASFGVSETDAATIVSSIVYTDYSYTEGEVFDWLFGDVQPGATKVFEDDETEVVAVGYFIGRNVKDESPTSRDIRHILFSAETYTDDTVVNQVYNEWVADGATIEAFEALVTKYSEDPGSASTGGLYEDVAPGEMVTEFNDWMFDPARKAGDHGIVKTSYGWHIMLAGASDGVAWKDTAKSLIQSETQTSVIDGAKKDYPVTINEEILGTLPA